jgi:AcrR family transcriptional regulator
VRVRTEARRRAIIEVASAVFRDEGFERATMSEIAKRLGGSKATLYGYFPSKEELFVACMEEEIAVESLDLATHARAIPDLRQALEHIGREVIRALTGERPVAVIRMVAGLPRESRLGLQFYERGVRQGWLKLSLYLEEQIAAGRMRPCNAWIATMHLKGMLESEYAERRTLNALPRELDRRVVERSARDAVDAFLRAYGPEPGAAPAP